MPASEKIITKLRERRQIEADLRKMLEVGSEPDFKRSAQRIASLGSQVIPTIIGNLDRADARMLAAMGMVATFLDRAEVTQALRQAVLQPEQTDQGRIGAMTILERFLGQAPDDALLASLADPDRQAVSSLEEVLHQAGENPAVLVQYIEELDRQEPDAVLALVRALERVGVGSPPSGSGSQVVELLRLMAQDVRDEIAGEALQALGAIRSFEAARALQVLRPTLAPSLRPVAERLQRKLQFSGVAVDPLPPPDPEWRALASPVNGLGHQSLWFILENRRTGHAEFLNVLLSDRAGAVEAVGHSRVPMVMMPARRSLGTLHDIALPDGSGALLMQEIAFNQGRRLLREALANNRETQIPVAGPLRLLSSWLWGSAGADSLPEKRLPELSQEDAGLLGMSGQLLEHPAFVTWTARSAATFQAAEEVLRHPNWDRAVWVRRLAEELFDPGIARILSGRLAAMSEWFLLAGEERRARLALVAANAALERSPQDQPFLQALVRRDLERVLQSLEHEHEAGPEADLAQSI
jgi:hypothetical protein